MIENLYGQLERYAAKLEELLKIYGHITDEELKEIRREYIKPAQPIVKSLEGKINERSN